MSEDISTIFREDEVIIALDGHPYTIDVDDERYDEVVTAIVSGDADDLRELLQVKRRANRMFEHLAAEGIEYDSVKDAFTYQGNELPMDLSDYLQTALDGGSEMSVVLFIKRLFENPNHRTRMHLFEFMEKNKHPISPDGRFIAYKAVRSNYLDKHSGTISNHPGAIMEQLPWSGVDTDPEKACSRGYHACSRAYVEGFFYSEGDRVVTIAVAPEDVGAIPFDYESTKLRCRGYEVLQDITEIFEREMPRQTKELGGHGRIVPASAREPGETRCRERDLWT